MVNLCVQAESVTSFRHSYSDQWLKSFFRKDWLNTVTARQRTERMTVRPGRTFMFSPRSESPGNISSLAVTRLCLHSRSPDGLRCSREASLCTRLNSDR